MIEPGNVSSEGEISAEFAFPALDVNSFQESAELSSFSGGPIRHNKKRNHTNTPYTRFTNPANSNSQPTHWLKSIINKFFPGWLREFIWPSPAAQRVTTEDASIAGSSNLSETENIVQSSIEELHGTIVEKEENHLQSSQLNAASRTSLKVKYSRLGSSRGPAVFGGRIKSSSMQRRGTIIRTRPNHISAREEDLLYPGEMKEFVPVKNDLSEIPSDWYKPFKDLTVNDSFSSFTSETSSSSKKETRATKKPSYKGPPLKKFRTSLVPDPHWFDYCPSEKSNGEKKPTPVSKSLTSKKQTANGTVPIQTQKPLISTASTKLASNLENKFAPSDQVKDPSTSASDIENKPVFGTTDDQIKKPSISAALIEPIDFGSKPTSDDQTKKPSTSIASVSDPGSKLSLGTSGDQTKKSLTFAPIEPASNFGSESLFGTPGDQIKKPLNSVSSTKSTPDFGSNSEFEKLIDQTKKPLVSEALTKPASDIGGKFTFGTLVDQTKEPSSPAAPIKPALDFGRNLTFGTPIDQTKKPSTSTTSNELASNNKLTFGMLASTKPVADIGNMFAFVTPEGQKEKSSASSTSTKSAFSFGAIVTPDTQIKKPSTSAASTKPLFGLENKSIFGTSNDQTAKSSASVKIVDQTQNTTAASASTEPLSGFGNSLTKLNTSFGALHSLSAAGSTISSIDRTVLNNEDQKISENKDASKSLNSETLHESRKDEALNESKVDGIEPESKKDETMLESKKNETVFESEKDEITVESKKDETTLEPRKDETTLESKNDETTLESKKDETILESKKDETVLESKKDEIALESIDSENAIESKKDETLDPSKGINLPSVLTGDSKETVGGTKDKNFSFAVNNSHPQTLASSPSSGSPMDIDMNNANHQVSVSPTLNFTSGSFGHQSFEQTLGKNIFNSGQTFGFSSGEMSSTEMQSNHNSKLRSSSFRKQRNKRAYESTGTEGRNILLSPKTEPSEGHGSNRMVMSEPGEFTFQLNSRKSELSIIPTQPMSTSSVFKFEMPVSQEMPGNPVGNPFQNTPISQPSLQSFQIPQNNFMPQIPSSTPIFSPFSNGGVSSFSVSQPLIFDTNANSSGSGSGAPTNLNMNNGAGRVLAKMRRPKKKF